MSKAMNTVPVATEDKADWSNEDNDAFYEAVKSEGLKKLAEKAGLTTGCDVSILEPYWSKAKSIFEAGAGYGRVIDYLIKHNFQGEITGIERCKAQFKSLKKQFSTYKNISLLNEDIRYYSNYYTKYDLVFLLWYGIADFSSLEQHLLIKKLKRLLKMGGHLIIDTIPENALPIASTNYGQQNFLIKADHIDVQTSINVHLLKFDDIKRLAHEAGFSNVKLIIYKTDNQRERWLYILS